MRPESSAGAEGPRYPRYRVHGDAAARSRRYGELARAEIRRTREGYERAFVAKGVSWDEAVDYSLGFVPAIERCFPHLLVELQGIAEGSGLSFAEVLTLNCRAEVLWRAAVRKAGSVAPWLRGECSSFSLEPHRTAAQRTLVGQNWDWLEVLSESVVVLEVEREDGPNYVTVVEAGLLAKTTMNQAGLAIAINTLVTSLDGGPHGVPFHVLVRAAADAEHVSDVVEMLSTIPRASSGNYMLGTADGAVLNVEVAPGDARTVHPIIAMNGAVIHTNHFVRDPAGGFDLAAQQMADSFVRYGRLQQRIVAHEAPLSVEALRAVLSDHTDAPNSVCCHPDARSDAAARWATLVSAIMEPATRTLHLAEGSPCTTEWLAHDYSELLASERAQE